MAPRGWLSLRTDDELLDAAVRRLPLDWRGRLQPRSRAIEAALRHYVATKPALAEHRRRRGVVRRGKLAKRARLEAVE